MNKIFEINIHVMGDVAPTVVQVFYSKKNEEYELGFLKTGSESPTESENPRVKFSEDRKIVQTAGTPLDSNTLHSISEELIKVMNL